MHPKINIGERIGPYTVVKFMGIDNHSHQTFRVKCNIHNTYRNYKGSYLQEMTRSECTCKVGRETRLVSSLEASEMIALNRYLWPARLDSVKRGWI
jgi:hypothetical protein